MKEVNHMGSLTDHERLSLGAVWADEAHQRVGDVLQRACAGRGPGRRPDIVTMNLDVLEALHDGLSILADTLHALNLPYPPPLVPPSSTSTTATAATAAAMTASSRHAHLSVVK